MITLELGEDVLRQMMELQEVKGICGLREYRILSHMGWIVRSGYRVEDARTHCFYEFLSGGEILFRFI